LNKAVDFSLVFNCPMKTLWNPNELMLMISFSIPSVKRISSISFQKFSVNHWHWVGTHHFQNVLLELCPPFLCLFSLFFRIMPPFSLPFCISVWPST
jgi:hypothetical protein